MEEADRAATFDELRDAGERYGKVMGRNAARAFALLATVAVGHTVAGFASTVPTLPGSAQAAALAGGRVGIRLVAVGEVGAVAVSGEAVTVALAPNAVAMTARAMGGTAAAPVDVEGHDHHIATNKWWKSTNDEGPWSPRFQRIFDKAGMTLDDPANIVHVKGHKGPHPKAYHQRIFERLSAATRTCRTMEQCREALTVELGKLRQDVATPGTSLNKPVTGTWKRDHNQPMPKRYFKLTDNMTVQGRWLLGALTDLQGRPLSEPWVFTDGTPLADPGRLKLTIDVPGKALDFSLAADVIPVVHVRVASVFADLAPDDVQSFPVEVEGQPEQFCVLVATKLIRCIDDKATKEILMWTPDDGRPEKVGEYRDVWGMRIDASQVGGAKVFRTWGWPIALIVREEIRDTLERMRATGTEFEEV